MNDEQLKVIHDLQDLLNISYREAYQIVDEYIYYGDVDLSEFDEIDDISQLTPKEKEIMLDILYNQEIISSLNTYEKEVLFNIMNNQKNISQLIPRDKEVLLNIMNNQESISQLLPREQEILFNILENNQESVSHLKARDKEVVLSLLNNTKIELLTTKPQPIDLGISNSNDSIQFLDIDDKELSIDIEFGQLTTPSHVDLDNINPLSISSISSIYQNDINVNRLDKLSISDIPTINNIEQQELKPLSLNDIRNIPHIEQSDMEILSLSNIRDVPSINLSNIELLDIGSISQLGKPLPNTRLSQLSIRDIPSVPHIELPKIDTLSINKLDNFKWGRINARVKRNDLPLLSLKDISDVNNIELSELDELVLYDLPQLPNFDIQEIKPIEYDSLHLDDNLDILNEIIKSDILPPVTKEYIISKGGDVDTVNDLYDTYRENSSSYSKSSIDVFFQYALAAVDEAIANGGKEKGLYKIVTEERGTFLPFITELYMTELCQYDYNPGLVIQEYLKVIKSFLVVEAEKYNLEVI